MIYFGQKGTRIRKQQKVRKKAENKKTNRNDIDIKNALNRLNRSTIKYFFF